MIGELIDANADVNAVKSDGSTALYLASLHGYHEVVAQLLTVKDQLDLNAGTSERWTALHAACARYCKPRSSLRPVYLLFCVL